MTTNWFTITPLTINKIFYNTQEIQYTSNVARSLEIVRLKNKALFKSLLSPNETPSFSELTSTLENFKSLFNIKIMSNFLLYAISSLYIAT